jgi:hypothetical protein
MYWKLEWLWECDDFTGSDVSYFATEEDAINFLKKATANPYKKITSMYLTCIRKII